MTTTEHDAAPTTAHSALVGIQHAGLTVTDVEASAAWYERVLGLSRQFNEPHHRSEHGGYAIVMGTPDMSLNVGLDHHPANTGEAFDPTRTGLDHLCLQTASLEGLHAWAAHLDAEGVEHSGVYAMDGMPISLLTFSDPDGIQLELIAFQSTDSTENDR
jgi:glyoxylase I family protein